MPDIYATRKLGLRLLLCVSLPVLAGCQNWGKQLYVGYETKLGIDASVNSSTGSGSIDLGYDRRFMTWVPRSVEHTPGNAESKEVMAVLACSELRVGFINIDYYDESLATGRAARKFATQLAEDAKSDRKVSSDYFECWKKDDTNDTTTNGQTASVGGGS